MLHLPHVSARLLGTPLMVHGGKLRAIMSGLAPRLGLRPPAALDDGYDDSPRPVRRPYSVTAEGIAVIPVVGLLANRSGGIDATSTPMASYEGVLSMTRAALADPDVRGVVHDYESAGGEAFGCFDAAKALAAMRGGKPIVACANAYAYSAAYMMASTADLIFVPESGEVGSVGVVAVHVDQSGADAKNGLAWEYIYQGARKVDGNPHEALSDDARAGIEAQVAHLYDLFLSGVAENRRISADAVRATEAACLNAPAALAAGLADRIGTLNDAVRVAALRASLQPNPGRAGARTINAIGGTMAIEDDFAAYKAQSEKDLQAAHAAAEQAKEATRAATEQAKADASKAALAHAASIMELCSAHGRPQDAAAHIAAGRSRGEVAEALLTAKAASQEQRAGTTSTAHQVGQDAAPADVAAAWDSSIRRVCGSVREGV